MKQHISSFNDEWLIVPQMLAQIFAGASLCLSFLWWPACVLSTASFILFQIPWFCLPSEGAIYSSASVASITAINMVTIGIYIMEDNCLEEDWAIVAFLCSALWGIAAVCMFCVVMTGCHVKYEQTYTPSDEESSPTENDLQEFGDTSDEETYGE